MKAKEEVHKERELQQRKQERRETEEKGWK